MKNDDLKQCVRLWFSLFKSNLLKPENINMHNEAYHLIMKKLDENSNEKLTKKELLADMSFVLFTWKKHYPHPMKPSRFFRIWNTFDKLKKVVSDLEQ